MELDPSSITFQTKIGFQAIAQSIRQRCDFPQSLLSKIDSGSNRYATVLRSWRYIAFKDEPSFARINKIPVDHDVAPVVVDVLFVAVVEVVDAALASSAATRAIKVTRVACSAAAMASRSSV